MVLTPEYNGPSRPIRGYWCPGSLCREVSNNGIDTVGDMYAFVFNEEAFQLLVPSQPWGMKWLRKANIFIFPQNNPAQVFMVGYDVINWKRFLWYCPFLWEIHRSAANSPHKVKWHGALMVSLIYARTDDWINNRDAGDLRRHGAYYDVTAMESSNCELVWQANSLRDFLRG